MLATALPVENKLELARKPLLRRLMANGPDFIPTLVVFCRNPTTQPPHLVAGDCETLRVHRCLAQKGEHVF